MSMVIRVTRTCARLAIALALTGIAAALALASPTPVAACDTACPTVASVFPAVVTIVGDPVQVTVNGLNLKGATSVFIEPEDVTVPFQATDLGRLTVTLAPATPDGDHWFVVETPGGTSQAHPPDVVHVIHAQPSTAATAAATTSAQALAPPPVVPTTASPGPPAPAPAAATRARDGIHILTFVSFAGIIAAAVGVAVLRLVTSVRLALVERLIRTRAWVTRQGPPAKVIDERLERL